MTWQLAHRYSSKVMQSYVANEESLNKLQGEQPSIMLRDMVELFNPVAFQMHDLYQITIIIT